MTVGDNIKQIRTGKKISIRKLAEMTGLSKSTLSDIENNKSQNPTIDTLEKIGRALGIAAAGLIDASNTSGSMRESKSERFLRSVARAKDRPPETQDKIADFIDFILEQEDKNK